MKRWKDIKENKGSSIIMVLIAMALIGTMVAIILMMVLLNYKMKAIDSKSKDTFYSAETALDEIKAGLESDVSDVYVDAYVDVMQQYTQYSEKERRDLFDREYASGLKNVLVDSASDGTSQFLYDFSTDKGIARHVTRLFDESDGTGVKVTVAENKQAILAFTTDGVVLKNLVVTYYEKQEFESRVRTDILLAFPDIDFTQTDSVPNLLEFALVADESLTVDSGQDQITGSVYGGIEGMTLKNSAKLSINKGTTAATKSNIIMTNGDISLKPGTSLTTDGDSNLWAKNIFVNSSSVNLSGITHVANDIQVSGSETNKVTLNGEYYGFGNPDTAKISNYIQDKNLVTDVRDNEANYSSSIVVNGINTELDFTGLSHLMISGNSYVGAKLKNTELSQLPEAERRSNSNDIRMGESISVKGNQIAYLVPSQFIGVGSENGGANPMTAEQYARLKTDVEQGRTSYVDAASCRDKTGAGSDEHPEDVYTTAFYPYNGSSIVYFYLKFTNADAAANYFSDYYANTTNQERIDRYLKLYTTGISYAPDSRATFNLYGNAMVYQNGETNVKEDNIAATESEEVLEKQQVSMQNTFGALGIRLVTSYASLSPNERTVGNVFLNLVKESGADGLIQAVQNNTTNQTIYVIETENTNLIGMMATTTNINLVAGDNPASPNNEVNYAANSNGGYNVYVGDESNGDSKKMRVLVATTKSPTDTLEITMSSGCHFNGLIIANGDVIMGNGTSITADANGVSKVLQAKDTAHDDAMIMNYLIDAEKYVFGSAINGEVTGTGISEGRTAVEDLVIYRHWKKE